MAKKHLSCRLWGYRILNVFPGVRKEVAVIPAADQPSYTLTDVAFPGGNNVYVSTATRRILVTIIIPAITCSAGLEEGL